MTKCADDLHNCRVIDASGLGLLVSETAPFGLGIFALAHLLYIAWPGLRLDCE